MTDIGQRSLVFLQSRFIFVLTIHEGLVNFMCNKSNKHNKGKWEAERHVNAVLVKLKQAETGRKHAVIQHRQQLQSNLSMNWRLQCINTWNMREHQ